MNFSVIFAVGIGGFFGAISRFLIATWMQKITHSLFPVGTLTVNVLGSFIIGFLYMYFEQSINPIYKAMFITGFLGALTTFSTFSLETLLMIQDGLWIRAFLNILLNVILTISSTFAAIILFKKMYGGL
ncbi:fluoride efflux transporter CrcB [Nitratiruptor sp. SB155-2]|uniref:Fluoride-specific ion channel FluC n=1 Tax=Nitratiruptor sp. (strain SB155-2) TaxID=387092 RepID=FLUC_NITSB|nr:fluoride efflux transporter CrcB [Nitratiruptor sp. SB155-2]A6Q4S3.1 RecName: Full=Fluoride-specific ion channel FluC [Nitratiruptor sp. SB155-2]BAF70482.1 camphor resistance protein CrcB [Nitratiruptor sp. SB155-2]